MHEPTPRRRPLGPAPVNPLKRDCPAPDGQEESSPSSAPSAKRAQSSTTVAVPAIPFDLADILVGLVEGLHIEQPTHPIFGTPAMGLIRLPLVATRANGQSWRNAMKKIGSWVASEMGENLGRDTCWMSRSTQLQITRPSGKHSSTVLRSITVVRLLAFLKAPTNDNWQKLDKGTNAIDCPFSHCCGRGLRTDGSQMACINGLYHGRFADRSENESHKLCTNGARCLCPGHGAPPVKCIFTHPDGTLKPCRNLEDRVRKCSCMRRCF